MTAPLEAKGVTMRFGGLRALADFNLTMEAGELVGLIGPNGAGKTTAFNAITGVYTPSEGEVRVCGDLVNAERPHQPPSSESAWRSTVPGSARPAGPRDREISGSALE